MYSQSKEKAFNSINCSLQVIKKINTEIVLKEFNLNPDLFSYFPYKYAAADALCSAGVGRTGTFIGLDIMIQRMKIEKKINIFDMVKQLRFQRMKTVQTIKQYAFLYQAALELSRKKRRPKGNLL